MLFLMALQLSLFIGCLKQFNMVGSRGGCIPAETQQVSTGWLEAPQCSLHTDNQLPTAMEGLPKNGPSDFFLFLRGISLRKQGPLQCDSQEPSPRQSSWQGPGHAAVETTPQQDQMGPELENNYSTLGAEAGHCSNHSTPRMEGPRPANRVRIWR